MQTHRRHSRARAVASAWDDRAAWVAASSRYHPARAGSRDAGAAALVPRLWSGAFAGRCVLVLLLGLVGCVGAFASTTTAPARLPELDAFFTRLTDEWMATNPDKAIAARYFDDERQHALERQLTPMTRDYALSRIALARRGLEELAGFQLTRASAAQQHAAAVLRRQLEYIVSTEPWLDYLKPPLQHYRGAGRTLVSKLTVSHPFEDAADAENYVQRLGWVDERMREAVAESARRAAAGIVMPSFIIDASVAQLTAFMELPVDANPFVSALDDKSRGLPGLSAQRRAALLARAREMLTSDILPAWQAAIEQLQRERQLASEVPGVSRLPQGRAFYAHQLAFYTSGSLSSEAVHQIGLAEVERISKRMLALFDRLGITEGSLEARTARLRERLALPDTAEGRAAMLADLQAHLQDAKALAPTLFDVVPRADVVIQAHPEFLWPTAAASYKAPAQDGSRPGIFQMPLRPDRLNRFGSRTLVFHETIPGHHYQLARLAEDAELPRFMQIRAFGSTAASSEGWALYAEQLAAESGWFEGDPAGLLGQLQAQLFRAKRLVVDTGLHSMGWTRQQAIDYGFSPSEVDRYTIWPGQACAYMMGKQRILALREQAQARLGESFSLRRFHNVVLGAGVVPLDILERRVQQYIDTELASAARSGVAGPHQAGS